ncbi:MAG: signal peptidase I [Polyangiaceae bacterium]
MAKFLRYLAWASVIIGVVVGLLRFTVLRWWQVPSGDPYLDASIAPTLHGGDWVVSWRGSAPKAGDLTMCLEPKTTRAVIGRIVGVQGERIKMERDALFVNDKSADNSGSCDSFSARDPATGLEVKQPCSQELVGDKTHLLGMLGAGATAPATADVQVAPAQAFLASDNRRFPWDSRDFGLVDRATCTETIVFRLVSKNGFFDVPNRLMLIH